jgi:triacylglycerol lipase
MINLKYPIMLVHGLGFHDDRGIKNWGRIPDALRKEGCKVFFGNQEGSATVEQNGRLLAQRIKAILKKTGAEKMNLIAHSKGGMEARYAISSLGMDRFVASLTTIATPHHGSRTMDFLMNTIPKWLFGIAADCYDLISYRLGDKHPDAIKALESFTTKYAKRFNKENSDSPRVYYQSYAFLMQSPFSELIELLSYSLVKLIEGDNDGFMTPRSAEWGNFRGVFTGNTLRGVSHIDVIDVFRKPFTDKKGKGISDIVDFYVDLVRDLKALGF